MSTVVWNVVESAMARHRPPRDQQWLADAMRVTPQAVHRWKKDGVPARRFRDLANLLGLTIDQLEGLEPLPWDRGWPFPDIEPERYYALSLKEKQIVQQMLQHALAEVERRHA